MGIWVSDEVLSRIFRYLRTRCIRIAPTGNPYNDSPPILSLSHGRSSPRIFENVWVAGSYGIPIVASPNYQFSLFFLNWASAFSGEAMMKKHSLSISVAIATLLAASLAFPGEAQAECRMEVKAQCPNADLRGVQWPGAKLDAGNFQNTNLESANLAGASLRNANLRGAKLNRAQLTQADFSGADLEGADLSLADSATANFSQARAVATDFSGANLENAHFYGTNLRRANLSQARLAGARMQRAHLEDADLSHGILSYADLTRANLVNADLQNADLRFTKLIGTYMSYANLKAANLTGATMQRTYLRGAHLGKAVWNDKRVCRPPSLGVCQ